MKTTVSFEYDGTDAEVISEIKSLFARLDPTVAVVEVKASKPKRILTEAQKKVIRERFAAGRAKAALAREAAAIASAKSIAKPKPSSTLPIPKTGHKVEAKPAAA